MQLLPGVLLLIGCRLLPIKKILVRKRKSRLLLLPFLLKWTLCVQKSVNQKTVIVLMLMAILWLSLTIWQLLPVKLFMSVLVLHELKILLFHIVHIHMMILCQVIFMVLINHWGALCTPFDASFYKSARAFLVFLAGLTPHFSGYVRKTSNLIFYE